MEPKEFVNPSAQSAHDKAQEAIDRARGIREGKLADRTKVKTEIRLIADGNLQRCSACGYPLSAYLDSSISAAFEEHLRSAHPPAQESEEQQESAPKP
jgi:hypothetical protein